MTLPASSTVTVVVTAAPDAPPEPVVTSTAPRPTVTVTRTAGGGSGGHAYTQWRSPSGNIGCAVSDGTVRCDAAEITFTPPQPAQCSTGVPRSIVLEQGDAPEFVCAAGTVLSAGAPVLEYGESTSSGGFTCQSKEDGMHCADDDSGAGFRLARGSYDLG